MSEQPKTWKDWCQAVMTAAGPPIEKLEALDRPECKFRCDRCSMEFQTAMKLDGIKHKALQINCGGTWKILGDGAK